MRENNSFLFFKKTIERYHQNRILLEFFKLYRKQPKVERLRLLCQLNFCMTDLFTGPEILQAFRDKDQTVVLDALLKVPSYCLPLEMPFYSLAAVRWRIEYPEGITGLTQSTSKSNQFPATMND
jgi:hypothetical protein